MMGRYIGGHLNPIPRAQLQHLCFFVCFFMIDHTSLPSLQPSHLVGLRGHQRVWDQMPAHILEDPVLPYFGDGRGISGAAQEIKHQVFNRKAIIYSVV